MEMENFSIFIKGLELTFISLIKWKLIKNLSLQKVRILDNSKNYVKKYYNNLINYFLRKMEH